MRFLVKSQDPFLKATKLFRPSIASTVSCEEAFLKKNSQLLCTMRAALTDLGVYARGHGNVPVVLQRPKDS